MGPVRASGWSWGAWNDSQMRFPQALTWVIFQTLDLIYATELCFSCQIVSDSFATLWILACQAPLSMGFPKQAYWSGLPFPTPRVGHFNKLLNHADPQHPHQWDRQYALDLRWLIQRLDFKCVTRYGPIISIHAWTSLLPLFYYLHFYKWNFMKGLETMNVYHLC